VKFVPNSIKPLTDARGPSELLAPAFTVRRARKSGSAWRGMLERPLQERLTLLRVELEQVR